MKEIELRTERNLINKEELQAVLDKNALFFYENAKENDLLDYLVQRGIDMKQALLGNDELNELIEANFDLNADGFVTTKSEKDYHLLLAHLGKYMSDKIKSMA